MKQFFNNIFILFGISVCLSIIIYIVVLFSDYLKVDLFYNSFTSIHQGSIIAGTSRGRYAFRPKGFENSLNLKNFCFTRSKSPYNNSYTKFLIDFTNPDSQSIAIFCVSPISFENTFEEKNEYFKKFNFVKTDFKKVNLEYLLEEKITPLDIVVENIKILFRNYFFGKDNENDNRALIISNRTIKEVNEYPIPEELDISYIKNLGKLINHFNKTSKVFLVRTPVIKALYEKENKLIPNFNSCMDSIADFYKIKYFDLNLHLFKPELKFYDISHVNKRESMRISEQLELLINSVEM